MKLTRRQKTVLRKFLDVYREHGEALHYTAVADHLGVSTVTAYDMLRLLEDRGLLTSEFVLPAEREGGGRAKVMFRPTPAGQNLFTELAGETWQRGEWNAVKERILQTLHAEKGSDYQSLLDDLLIRITEQRPPLLYAAETITAIILQAYQLEENVADSKFMERLRSLGLPDEVGLNAISGLVVGLSYVERANRRATSALLAQTSHYQEMLGKLSQQSRRRLADFVTQVMDIVES